MTLPKYHPLVIGNYCFTQQVVCNSGAIVTVSIEQYAEGYKAIAKLENGEKVSHRGVCKTSRKAINAIAKLI